MIINLHRRLLAFFTIALILLSQNVFAEVSIGLFLNKQTLILGEASPVLSITAQNSGPVLAQDVHIGVISPSGTIYEFPNGNTALQPWLPNFSIPANFQLGNTVITDLNFVPGGLTAGIWQAYFALTTPGTIDINDLQLVGLNVVDSSAGGAAGNGSRFGTVSINRTQSVAGTDVKADAGFYEANTSFPNLQEALQGQPPVIDECNFIESSSDPFTNPANDFTITSLDAGEISIVAGDTIQFDKDTSSSFISYSATPSLSFFDNAGNFTFNGTGGPGVGAFTTTISSTNSLDLIAPSPTGTFSINAGQNFDLVWANNNFGAGEVLATLSGSSVDFTNPSATTVFFISCRFIDDGQGTIPANLLTQLQQALPADPGFNLPVDIPGFSGLSQLNLSINRTNSQFFTTNAPSLNVGIATVSSGVFLSGGFQ